MTCKIYKDSETYAKVESNVNQRDGKVDNESEKPQHEAEIRHWSREGYSARERNTSLKSQQYKFQL